MDTFVDTKTPKPMDPIWKRLRVDRFWAILFIIYTVFFLGYALWDRYFGLNKDAGLIWIYLFNILFWGNSAVGHFQKERYWKRIGQRRLEAINDAQSFLATNQPPKDEQALTLPLTLRLHWQRSIVIAVSVLVLIPVLLLFIFGTLTLRQHNQSPDTPIVIAIFILSLVILGFIVYLTYLRGIPSLIELNEVGIKTRYIQQERFLRWDEVRTFASYGAQGTKKSAAVLTYEVSNEHTIVRWSQQMLTNPFLVLESTLNKKEDWNWVIGRVNSIVASRTNLPLLDLSDRGQQHSVSSGRRSQFVAKQEVPAALLPSHTSIPIAQDDPLVRRMQLNGETGKAIGILAVVGVIAFLLGLFGKFSNYGTQSTGFLSVENVNVLLTIGILLLILVLFLVVVMQYSRSYWKRIARKRQEALQQPERFRVSGQQEAQAEQPSPATIRIRLRKTFLFPLLFIENFVIWFIFTTMIFHWPQKNLLVTIISVGCVALLMSALFLPILGRSSGSRIELRSDGIATRYGTVDSYVSWNDARLFARYGAFQLVRRSSRIQLYELASEHTVVRWQWSHSRLWRMAVEPEMSREEFDRWLGQLQSYGMARTGLSLMDLDSGTLSNTN